MIQWLVITLVGSIPIFGPWFVFHWGVGFGERVTKHAMLEDITEALGVEAATTFVAYSIGKRGR